MARSKFHAEVLTPEGEVFNGEVEMVSTKTVVGSIGILANHAPLMAMLDPTELRLYESESDIVRFAQGEGYVQVADNLALVIVEEAVDPETLDRAELEAKLDDARKARDAAEETLKRTDDSWSPRSLAAPEHRDESEAYRRAAANVKRFEAFLEIAGGGSE